MISTPRACLPPSSSHPASGASGEALCSVRILDVLAEVTGPRHLLDELPTVFPPPPSRIGTGAEVRVRVELRVLENTPRPGTHAITRDGSLLCHAPEEELLAYVEWAINSTVVDLLSSEYLLLHAGAVAYAGNGLILPAVSGSGKTTLTAALLAAGFEYFSDEVAAVRFGTRQLQPFPKSLSVKPGSCELLAPSYPMLASSVPRSRFGCRSVHYLPPPVHAWPSTPVPVRYIVFPRYVPGGETELLPISRSEALPRVLEQFLSAEALGAQGMGGIVDLLQSVRCYSLTVGHLPRAVQLLSSLLAA